MGRIKEINPFRGVSPARALWAFPLAILAFFALACGKPAGGPEPARADGEWRTFEGTLNATGYRQLLRLGLDGKGAVFHLKGSLLLFGERRLGTGFQCDMIGRNHTAKGLDGWAAWTDSRGDQVFSEVKGDPIGGGRRILGTILGGTGRYAGIAGDYEFVWKLVVGDESADEATFQVWVDGLRGRFRLIAPDSSPPPKGSPAPENGRSRS